MAKRKEKQERRSVVLEPDAAGIDIGAEEIYVAVPPDRDEESTRRFSSFTCDLHALADWLGRCRIPTVAMESTAVYWIPAVSDIGGAWMQGLFGQRALSEGCARTRERRWPAFMDCLFVPPIDLRVYVVVGPLAFASLFPSQLQFELFESKHFATATEDECPQSVVTAYSR